MPLSLGDRLSWSSGSVNLGFSDSSWGPAALLLPSINFLHTLSEYSYARFPHPHVPNFPDRLSPDPYICESLPPPSFYFSQPRKLSHHFLRIIFSTGRHSAACLCVFSQFLSQVNLSNLGSLHLAHKGHRLSCRLCEVMCLLPITLLMSSSPPTNLRHPSPTDVMLAVAPRDFSHSRTSSVRL